ncbi:hypothetical protein ACFFP0_23855 [Rhizobium puerariae]|uniref:Uncharacterized protein n=1 Tax=Rhizobium puerariae TaxID=1585791 RepID=A0ABV6ARH1_9HYPH
MENIRSVFFAFGGNFSIRSWSRRRDISAPCRRIFSSNSNEGNFELAFIRRPFWRQNEEISQICRQYRRFFRGGKEILVKIETEPDARLFPQSKFPLRFQLFNGSDPVFAKSSGRRVEVPEAPPRSP